MIVRQGHNQEQRSTYKEIAGVAHDILRDWLDRLDRLKRLNGRRCHGRTRRRLRRNRITVVEERVGGRWAFRARSGGVDSRRQRTVPEGVVGA